MSAYFLGLTKEKLKVTTHRNIGLKTVTIWNINLVVNGKWMSHLTAK